MDTRKMDLTRGWITVSKIDQIPTNQTITHTCTVQIAQPAGTAASHPYRLLLRAAHQSGGGEWFVWLKCRFEPGTQPAYQVNLADTFQDREFPDTFASVRELVFKTACQAASTAARSGGVLWFTGLRVHPIDFQEWAFVAAAEGIVRLTQIDPFTAPTDQVRRLFRPGL